MISSGDKELKQLLKTVPEDRTGSERSTMLFRPRINSYEKALE